MIAFPEHVGWHAVVFAGVGIVLRHDFDGNDGLVGGAVANGRLGNGAAVDASEGSTAYHCNGRADGNGTAALSDPCRR